MSVRGCGNDIPVKQCGPFAQDPAFAAVRKTLPPTWLAEQSDCGSDSANMDNVNFYNDRFEVVVNVKEYAPQEIRCSVTSHTVELIAQHGGTDQSGTVQRNMTLNRTYQLPQKINPYQAICCLSSNGMLVVTAPWSR